MFANFLLADEINRAPAKVQSALLEVMQEHQVTIGGTTYQVPQPFLVLATENPIEAEGTYPLPEAQVDRFMLKILLDYPSASEEAQIVARSLRTGMAPREILDVEGLQRLQAKVDDVYVDPRIVSYAVGLVEATRKLELLGRARARVVRLVRRQPARFDQPRPGRARPGRPARPALRPPERRHRACSRRPAPPPGPQLRRPDRRRHRGHGHRRASSSSCRAPQLDLRDGADGMTDLARAAGRERTPARPGPGPIADDLVRRLEFTLSRRVGGRMTGDHAAVASGRGWTSIASGRTSRAMTSAASIGTRPPAAGVPQIREDVPDRQLTAWLVLDTSPSMHFGTADRRKADVAEGAALVVGRFVARRSDRLGVVTFGAGRERRHPAVRWPQRAWPACCGAIHADVARGRLAARPRSAAPSRPSPHRGRRAGLVTLISDFRGPLDWRSELTAVAARHTVLAIEIVDPREGELVDVGELTLIDPETGRMLRVDTRDRRLRDEFRAAAAASAPPSPASSAASASATPPHHRRVLARRPGPRP